LDGNEANRHGVHIAASIVTRRLPIVVGLAALAIGYRREAPPAPGPAPA